MVGGAGGGVSTSVCSVGGGNKIVATLRADCKVYPTTEGTTISQLANLMNYKIRTTECDQRTLISGNLNENVITVTTPAIDAGKQLLQCARDKDLKGVKNALARAAPFTSDWLGMSALHFAAMNNQYEMCEVLLNGGINKDSKTKVDRTPLHLACFYGNEKVARILLSRGCLVNSRDMLKMTPLHWAVEKGHKSIVRLLLKHDADVTAVSKFGRTPIALAVLTEQADLLEELEAARQQQINIKFNKEHEKETSEAVNSIMCLNKRNSIDGATMEEAIRKLVTDDGLIDQNDYTSETMVDLDNIKEVGILGDSAVKLLKSHGISMMPDDEQESKKLLTTALQNGRQLVLSEGGKLLLNEAKKLQRNQNNNKNSSNDNNNNHNGDNSNMNNNSNSNSNNNNNNNNSIKIKVPVSHSNKSNAATAIKGNLAVVTNCNATDSFKTITIAENKCNANIIKSKDHMLVSSKGKVKNIRIISLNDFKKLYGNTNVKTLQSLPTSLTANRLVKIRPISKQPLQQKQQMNSNQANDNNTNANQNQNKVSSNNSNAIVATSPADNNNVIKEEDSLSISDIIAMQNVEVEKELELENSTSPPPLKIIQPSPGIQRLQQQQQQQQQQIHLLPGRRLISASQIRHVTGNSNNNSSNKNTSLTNNNHSTYKPYNNNHKQNSCAAVVPLLTLSEVSRQLMELRKQCEEFRRHKDELRKLDLAQKELRKQNEELRKQNEEYRRKLLQKEKDDTNRRVATERDLLQRLERLEELLLVERTDEDATKS